MAVCTGVAADEVADDDGVGRIIQLLEQVPQHKRHGEEEQLSADAALRHEDGIGSVSFHL